MAKVKIQGHASGTGILTVTAPNTSTDRTITLPDGTGTLIADDGSGKVGIGTASPNHKLSVSGAGSQGTLGLYSSGTSNELRLEHDGGSHWVMNGVSDGIRFKASNSEKIRIDGDGLKFNGDTAAANALDDYEEGDWTPTWVVANGTVTSYNNLNTGKYTKIGRTVFIWGYLSFGSQSGTTSTDDLNLGGLPFAAGNGWGQSSAYTGGVHTIGLYNWGSGKAPDYSHFGTGSSHRLVRKDGTTEVALTVADFNTNANHSQFRFQGQYNIA
jgi:hypothetical protein